MMSNSANILQNKRLADVPTQVQSVLQVLLVVAIVVGLGIGWWRYRQAVFVMPEPKITNAPLAADTNTVVSRDVQPLSFYTDLVGQRNIFRFLPADSSGVSMQPESIAAPHQDLMSRYTVQGIVYDHNPLAIIKDHQSQKTYFLHRFEMLEEAKLVDIRENRVIFNRNGETLELIKK